MRSFLLAGMVCGIFCLGSVSAVDGGPYSFSRCGNCGGCGGGYDWWSLQPCQCADRDCAGDCGYPFRWPYGCRSCDPCGDCCRPMTCHDRTYCGPLTGIFALFTCNSWCGTGCGERYWGDFYGDPPDLCDPCDRCGNYIGRGCGYAGGSYGYGRGCNCNGGGGGAVGPVPTEQVVPMEGRVISKGDRVISQAPTPAKTRKTTTRQ